MVERFFAALRMTDLIIVILSAAKNPPLLVGNHHKMNEGLTKKPGATPANKASLLTMQEEILFCQDTVTVRFIPW